MPKDISFHETYQEIPLNIENPMEPHLACVLLLDTSGSMSYSEIENCNPIEKLNMGVRVFLEKTSKDENVRKRVDLAIIEFNDRANLITDFSPIYKVEPPTLTAGGCTAMGEAINLAIDKVKERALLYASECTPIYQPWIVMFSDGAPTDDITEARQRISEEESKGMHGKFKFWALGVPGYDEETLKSLTKRCLALDGYDFEGFFDWLSEHMSIIGPPVLVVDDNPQLPPVPDGVHVISQDW